MEYAGTISAWNNIHEKAVSKKEEEEEEEKREKKFNIFEEIIVEKVQMVIPN